MDIDMLSTQFVNQAFNPFSTADQSMSVLRRETSVFEDLIRRTQEAQNSSQGDFPSSTIPGKIPIDKNDKLYELCLELETFLVKNLIKSMRSTVQKSSLIESGLAGEMYEDMLYDEYAKTFSRNANFGFAEMAYRELSMYS